MLVGQLLQGLKIGVVVLDLVAVENVQEQFGNPDGGLFLLQFLNKQQVVKRFLLDVFEFEFEDLFLFGFFGLRVMGDLDVLGDVDRVRVGAVPQDYHFVHELVLLGAGNRILHAVHLKSKSI